jgi:hypothetical protein
MGGKPDVHPPGNCPASSECLANNATEDFQLMSTRFSLGIDLGTTNSAMALTDLETDQTEVLEVTQILGPNQIGEKPTLPSALYIPHRDEFPENSFPLPWENGSLNSNSWWVRARSAGWSDDRLPCHRSDGALVR